jgi:glycolate dehydrogenase FAD-binding subunit
MSMAATAMSESLGKIVGSPHLTTNADDLRAYAVGGKVPKAAIRAGSDQEVAEIVRLARLEKLTVLPTGARTKQDMNIPVGKVDLALDMARLDRVVAYDPGDLTLSVEAGVPLRQLAATLAEHRQFLPLAVPFFDRATVGGTIASGVDSPFRQFYGTARDYVLGMEFVTGDGRVVKSGGRVVKNVSGYDLHKLMIGSFGSLGVITKVNFRTFPVADSIRAFIAWFASPREAMAMRHQIAQSPLRPLTLEILSPQAAELLFCAPDVPVESELGSIGQRSRGLWAVLISFAGLGKALDRYEREVRRLGGASGAALLGENAVAAALARVREFCPIALAFSPATVIMRMNVMPSEIAQTLDDAAAAAAKAQLRWAAMARGVGVIDFALSPNRQDSEVHSRISCVIDDVFQAFGGREGSITVPWCKDARSPAHTTSRSDLALMRKIRDAFDPGRTFAPDPVAAWT